MSQKRKGRWTDYSDLELLLLLKEEIIRIGIDDYPSKTEFNKKYDKDKSPSASSILYRFDKSWSEIMEMIGLEYDKSGMAKERGKLGNGVQRGVYKTQFSVLTDDEFMMVLYKEIKRLGVTMRKEYIEQRDKENTPTPNLIKRRIGSWDEVMKRCEEIDKRKK